MIWFGWVLWYMNYCRLFNAKSFLYIYIKYSISKPIFYIIFLNEPEVIFLHTVKCFANFYLIRIILFTINNLFASSKCFQVLLFNTNVSTKHEWLVCVQLNDQTVLFQTIHFSISTKLNGSKYQSFIYTQLNDQTVLFQAIQFSISHLFAFRLNVKPFYLTHW